MKNKRFTSALCMLICMLLLLPVIAGCGDTEEKKDDETSSPVAATTSEAAVEEVTTADPFAGVNFNKASFTLLCWQQGTLEYYGEEGTGDMIESALFKRNSIVQDKLGIEFSYIELAGNSSTFKDFCQTATNNINTTAHEYDAIACYTRTASLLMINGVLANLLDTEYMNFSNPWWPESLVQLNTIGDKLYFASGDIATSLLYQMMFMAINNDVAKELNISGVQEKALAGEWTIDYMLEIIKDSYSDLDPVGTYDYSDRYGLVIPGHTLLDTFYIGAGLKYVELDTEGEAHISESLGGDISLDIISKLQKSLFTDKDALYTSKSDEYKSQMASGTSLLYLINGSMLQNNMNGAGYDYSILCGPKYNAEQENYYTAVGFPHSMYCIPTDAKDMKMSGAALECLAMESYNEVTPVLFDTAFKYRYANTSADSDMFDIIRSGVVFDLGRTFFDQLGGDSSGPVRIWRNEIYNNTQALTRLIKSSSKGWTKALETTIASIKG